MAWIHAIAHSMDDGLLSPQSDSRDPGAVEREPGNRAGDTALAGRATRLLYESTFVFWGHFVARAGELGLPPAQAHALMVFPPDRVLRMRELAEALGCDPSTMTGLADRLERQGLVERRTLAGDRRVKALALTAEGAVRRARLLGRLAEAPASVQALDPRALAGLTDALERVLSARPGTGGPGDAGGEP